MTSARTAIRRTVSAAAAALLITACGGTGTQTNAPQDQAGTTNASFPRTITHDKGTTQLPEQPQRIVALDNSLVEAIVLLERPLVGGISSYRDQKGFPPYLGDAVAKTEDVGPLDTPDLEAIAALKPDVIVSATVRHDALYDELSKIAPTVFVKTTGPQWRENVTFLGTVLGVEDKATAELSDYKARAKTVGDAINAKAGNPTISIVRFLDGPTRLMQNKSFIGHILSDAGLARPASQDVDAFAAEVGEEQIRLADADHIFVTSFSGGEASKERFQRNPLWSQLEAVQAGNVKDVADEIWMTSVSVQGAHLVLDDLAATFAVDDART
ncbi:MAG: iron-siderophore ABC transporter substrate-binding protein [Actinobacteria bacterium]|nr:iron-siderophore ABC transporter substrate-binding protein [Actinomycetota bacterium]MBW3646150.1 iron-siderophore ABC transporter substrate-binding protein [Actinomycetota bacterium]